MQILGSVADGSRGTEHRNMTVCGKARRARSSCCIQKESLYILGLSCSGSACLMSPPQENGPRNGVYLNSYVSLLVLRFRLEMSGKTIPFSGARPGLVPPLQTEQLLFSPHPSQLAEFTSAFEGCGPSPETSRDSSRMLLTDKTHTCPQKSSKTRV